MDSVEQYHDILCDFFPDVLSYIILDYAIFSTQEFFLKSFDNNSTVKMVREENIVYEYYGMEETIKKRSYDADTHIYSDKMFIHKNLIYVLDGLCIHVFNEKCEKTCTQTFRFDNLKIFVYDDKIYKHYSIKRDLYFSYINEKCSHKVTFNSDVYLLKYKDKNIYALLWNNNIIKYSIENNMSILVHKYNDNVKPIRHFCIVDEHIYILRVGSHCKIDIYDHHTKFIRSFNEKPLYRAYSIDCYDNILYIRDTCRKFNIYEIRHKSLFLKN